MAAARKRLSLDDLPAATRQRLGLKKTRTTQFPKDQVRTWAIRVLAVVADLTPDQRRRVLQHAAKLNQQ
jgi:hypothetical protein